MPTRSDSDTDSFPLRGTGGRDASELSKLNAHLDNLRTTILHLADGLTDVQAHRLGIPSGMSIIGLLADLVVRERYWFGYVFAGVEDDFPFGEVVGPERSIASVIADYRAAIAASQSVIEGCTPDTASAKAIGGDDTNLRWIMFHMIEETARHVGHAEVLLSQVSRTDA